MLRLVSLDLCDASDGDFEIPDVSYRRAIFFKKKKFPTIIRVCDRSLDIMQPLLYSISLCPSSYSIRVSLNIAWNMNNCPDSLYD